MTRHQPVDLLVVGAGPAGLAAAIAARAHGLSVTVVDEQPAPGGQIWRAVEQGGRDAILGPAYVAGRAVVARFRASGASYLPGAQVWCVEPGGRVFLTRGGAAQMAQAGAVLLAVGAQERPTPFPGWTLPGVITVGAAQILLKSAGQVPAGEVWVAGAGPLPLLYMVQLLAAGGRVAGYLDTTPRGQWRAAARLLPAALRAWPELAKGLGWIGRLRGRIRWIGDVADLAASGNERLEEVQYRTRAGAVRTVRADALLVHEGVAPNIHPVLSLGAAVRWDEAQACYAPALDPWGESSQAGIFVAGDAAGVVGASAALVAGELAALRIASQLGRLSPAAALAQAQPLRRRLAQARAARPFLDALYRPRPEVFAPPDETLVCRCEEVTAGTVRALAAIGRPGPNQVKAACRAGMGPCQGRQCGYTLTHLLAAVQQRAPADVGFIHVRPPLKPVTLGELAALDEGAGGLL